jgi:hypothetical protein
MAGIDDADAHPLAGRQARGARHDGARAEHRPDGPETAPIADDEDGPDETDLDAVTRLMGFLRADLEEQ